MPWRFNLLPSQITLCLLFFFSTYVWIISVSDSKILPCCRSCRRVPKFLLGFVFWSIPAFPGLSGVQTWRPPRSSTVRHATLNASYGHGHRHACAVSKHPVNCKSSSLQTSTFYYSSFFLIFDYWYWLFHNSFSHWCLIFILILST